MKDQPLARVRRLLNEQWSPQWVPNEAIDKLCDEIERLRAQRAEVEPSKPTIHKPVWDGTILIGSDCTINGTKVKAGTVLRPGDILPDELSSDMNEGDK